MTLLMERMRRKKQREPDDKISRDVITSCHCPECDGEFWSPPGTVVCPWCGKRVIVNGGITGSVTGFFSKMLEGIALSGGVSRIEVSHPYPVVLKSPKRP